MILMKEKAQSVLWFDETRPTIAVNAIFQDTARVGDLHKAGGQRSSDDLVYAGRTVL